MIDTNVDKVINYIKKLNGNSSDIVDRIINIKDKKICYICLESVSSDDKISDFFMKYVDNYIVNNKSLFDNLFENLKNTIPNSHIGISCTYDDVFYKLASGFTCIFVEGEKNAITIETKTSLDRGVTEATSEAIIRGPKDSFTENHQKNIGLIRKRIKDYNLFFNDTVIGKRTKTKVTIGYINGVCNKKIVKNIEDKLKKIDIDGILDSGYIREFLTKDNKTSFPMLISTERPDLACMSLLEGKIIILVENTPFCLIIPGLFIDFLHSPEDNYQKPINISLTRILRLLAFFTTILLPGLYVALTTFNQQIIPDELLISLAVEREGVPFPTAIEMLIMIISFEILRESDIRIPNASGAAIGIVGALVLGDAAVTAGIVSPIVIIIIGLTSISGLLFTDIDFVNGLRWWRLLFLFLSTIFGILGFLVCSLIFITRLCALEYEGIPYLTPIAPYYEHNDVVFRKPRFKAFRRLSILSNNHNKLGDKNED